MSVSVVTGTLLGMPLSGGDRIRVGAWVIVGLAVMIGWSTATSR